jgi:2'-5' RNA ligase
MSQLLRAFIAIELTRDIRQAIARESALLKGRLKNSVRWVPAENIHLTLKFLGDVTQPGIDMLKQSLAVEASQHNAFDLTVADLGSFPNPRQPRIIWIGLQAPPALARLQRAIESSSAKIGYPPENKPFSPHLTIGRVREQITPAELTAIRSALAPEETMRVGELGRMHVDALHLFKSDLQPGGAVYTCLFSAPLIH